MSLDTHEHREIIDIMAKNGWRYIGVIPVVQRSAGFVEEMDLVFEKCMD